MDSSIIIAILSSTINAWVPVLLASVKNPASKAKMKKASPALRAAGVQLVQLADQIDAVSAKKRRR